MMLVINPAVGCHCFQQISHARGYLPSFKASPPLAGTNLYWYWTEACVWKTCLGPLHDCAMALEQTGILWVTSPMPSCLMHHHARSINNWKHWDSAYLHQSTSCQSRDTDPDPHIQISDSDHHQNLIICSLAHCQPSVKIKCKSVQKFLLKVANRQTNRQTMKKT